MTTQEIKLHAEIEDRLLCIMDDVDLATTLIFTLRNKCGFDYSEHLNKLSKIKSDTKHILNKDFDKLAVNHKS
jgi:hypothetical protein